MGERIRSVEVRKFVSWGKDSLIGKAKAIHANKAMESKEGIHHHPGSESWCPLTSQLLLVALNFSCCNEEEHSMPCFCGEFPQLLSFTGWFLTMFLEDQPLVDILTLVKKQGSSSGWRPLILKWGSLILWYCSFPTRLNFEQLQCRYKMKQIKFCHG